MLLGEVRKIKGVNRILGERSGVHILLEMAEPWTEQELVRLAAEAGVRVYPLSEYCIDDRVYEPAVLLGYAAVTEDEIRQSVRILSKVWNRKKEDAV